MQALLQRTLASNNLCANCKVSVSCGSALTLGSPFRDACKGWPCLISVMRIVPSAGPVCNHCIVMPNYSRSTVIHTQCYWPPVRIPIRLPGNWLRRLSHVNAAHNLNKVCLSPTPKKPRPHLHPAGLKIRRWKFWGSSAVWGICRMAA